MNLKVFNLVSGVKETRFIVQHESSECKCELNECIRACEIDEYLGVKMKY